MLLDSIQLGYNDTETLESGRLLKVKLYLLLSLLK